MSVVVLLVVIAFLITVYDLVQTRNLLGVAVLLLCVAMLIGVYK